MCGREETMQKRVILKFRKSSIIGVLIIYYMLMDSSFPFAESGSALNFFYWTKFALAIVVVSYAAFSVTKRDVELKSICKRTRHLFFIPWLLMILYSCIIWIMQKTAIPYITRGISNFIANIIPILLGVALVLIYREGIIRLVVIAICMMAFTNYIMGIIVNGLAFVVQLFNINCEESTFRIYKELHEIAYIAGLLLLYYFHKKEYRLNKGWLISVFIVFFFAWKRIGILALVMAFIFYALLKHINKSGKKSTVTACGIVALVLSILYVWMSASDELSTLLHEYGINMMGRDVIYSYFRKFCDFSIIYLGHGIGFVSRQFNFITWEDVGVMIALKQGLHNDLFSLYLEIGMIGFITWCVYQLIYIPQKIRKWFGIDCAVRCFTYIIYTFVTYTTDNTLRYFVYQMTLVILIAVTCYENCKKKNNIRQDHFDVKELRKECK